MKGQSFKTQEGEIIKVEDFDADNKMAYVHISSGQYRWYTEAEYSTWTRNDTSVMPKIYVPDVPAQMTEEQTASVTEEVVVEKPKKTIKKKNDA